MFKNFASDALGLSDLGKIIPPSQYQQTDADDYIFHEDNEKIYFLIKSKTDEYCFTNVAFIHLDGQSATSKKRLLKRYPYRYHQPANVMIETAGTIDLDAELKFNLGGMAFSIDIDKNQIEQIRDIYKALTAISEQCKVIDQQEHILKSTFDKVTNMIDIKTMPETILLNLPDIINQTVLQIESGYSQRLSQIRKYDFGDIFEHYIHR
ncbi:PH domain-containing protein [Acinetobacter sp. c3-l95]|uniref:PH domain-containing protein n=1 Tax=Acinetobacter sp. c3-l95 TaxID=3342804 RepID=UPI0035BAC2C2